MYAFLSYAGLLLCSPAALTDDQLRVIEINTKTVAGYNSGRILSFHENKEFHTHYDFAWLGKQSRFTRYEEPSTATNTTKLRPSLCIVGDKLEYSLEKLTYKDGAIVDPRTVKGDAKSYELFGVIRQLPPANVVDTRSVLVLLHPTNERPRSPKYTTSELLTRATSVAAKRLAKLTKASTEAPLELELIFPVDDDADIAKMVLRFDPDHGQLCYFREWMSKTGSKATFFVDEFQSLPEGQYFPKKLRVFDSFRSEPATVSINDVKLNSGVTPSDFVCPFPDNVYVRDDTRNIVLLMGKDGKEKQVLQIKEFQRKSNAQKPAKRPVAGDSTTAAPSIWPSISISSVLVTCGVLVIAAAIVYKVRFG